MERRLVMDASAPTLTGFVDVSFAENLVNAEPQPLGNTVVVTDDAGDWDGGTLTVSGLLGEDRVGVQPGLYINRVGDTVRYYGTTIGTIGTGLNQTGVGESLVVTFNSDATTAGVQEVVRALSYQNVSDTPTASRNLTVVLSNAGGETSTPEQGSPGFLQRTGDSNPFGGILVSSHSDPALGDLDGDGDLDLVVGDDGGPLKYYRNVGTDAAPAFERQIGLLNPFEFLPVGLSTSPELVDLDGDGDLDLAVGNFEYTDSYTALRYFRNDGTATAPAYLQVFGASNPFDSIVVDSETHARPTFGDVDGDGDLDLLVGLGANEWRYYRNDGTALSPLLVQQTGVDNPFDGMTDVGPWSTPALGDVDGDGDLDLAIGQNNTGQISYLLNTGTATAPAFAPQVGPENPFGDVDLVADGAHVSLADIDGDGSIDLVVGDVAGFISLFQRDQYSLQVTVTAEPETPPSITAGGAPVVADAGGSAVFVDPALTIDGGSYATLGRASVSITGSFDPAEDVLVFDDQAGISGSYEAATGILTLTGTASIADYQAALRSVRYENLDAVSPSLGGRTITFSIAPGVFNPTNGHFYEFVADEDISWTDARVAALGRSLFGMQGYLATITSADENDFAYGKARAYGWIGASDSVVEGEWRWVDGPEAGQLFWQDGVGAVGGMYNSWFPGEPSNSLSIEHFARYENSGIWNDVPNAAGTAGYIVEYGGGLEDPLLQLISQATVGVVTTTQAPTVATPSEPVLTNMFFGEISGTAEAGSLVRVYFDVNNNGVIDEGDEVANSQQLGVGETSYSMGLLLQPDADNNYLVTATATGKEESDPVDVPTITTDLTPPALPTLVSPNGPIVLDADEVTLAVEVEAGSLVEVYEDTNDNGQIDDGDLFIDSRRLKPDETNYSLQISLTPNTTHRLLVEASDAAGNRSEALVVPTITEDSIAPDAPVVTTPAEAIVVNGPNAIISGTAETGSLVVIFADVDGNGQLDEGDLLVGSQQLEPGQTAFAIEVPLMPDASNRFLAFAMDAASNRALPAIVPTIVQDSTAPAMPVVTSPVGPIAVDAVTSTLSGTAEAGSLVEVFDDANGNGILDEGESVVGSQQLGDGQTAYSIVVPLSPDAANRFLVAATDAAGNRSAARVVPTITEDSTPAPVEEPSTPVEEPSTPVEEPGTPVEEPGIPISGVVFLDVNADGILNEGEMALPNRTVFVDQNGNGILDAGEPSTTSGPDGSFDFPGITRGQGSVSDIIGLDGSRRFHVSIAGTRPDGSSSSGVVPFSPIAPVHVTPNPFEADGPADTDSAYVRSLYRAVLGRSGSEEEVQGWVDLLGRGMGREAVALGFVNSPEHRWQQVEFFYQTFLGRSTDPTARHWVNALLAGASEEQVVEAILISDEYQAAHQDADSFVRDLYLDVLGRRGEDAGLADHKASLASGVSREAIIAQFVRSDEAVDQVLAGFYSSYLRRGRDGFSRGWASQMKAPGGSATSAAVGILSSDEFIRGAGRTSS